MPQPAEWTVWRHVATDSLYTVIGTAACSTNGLGNGALSVVYFSHSRQVLWYRDLAEFMDGRFELVPPD